MSAKGDGTDGVKPFVEPHERHPATLWRRMSLGWFGRLGCEIRCKFRLIQRHMCNAAPLEQIRLLVKGLALLLGGVVFVVLALPYYDRALVLTGHTEVLSMRLDNAAFGDLTFDSAVFRIDPDTVAEHGRLQLDIAPGTTVRFVRLGRGALRLSFAAGASAPFGHGCATGLRTIGSVMLSDVPATLCDTSTVMVPLVAESDPLVLGLSGGIVVGEEVSEGAGSRPLLLDATASLLVKHDSVMFRKVCSWTQFLSHFCDRFVANSVTLSPGDSVSANGSRTDARTAVGLGFIRMDPSELQSGMMFNLAATASAFEVQRMQGEAFTVRESIFDVIEKSPVIRTLNTILLAVGFIWYFLRLPSGGSREGGGGTLPAILAGSLLFPLASANAQVALLRADETGQGLLRSRGDRCYAVTPSHVMGSETSALVTAPGRERGEGDLIRRIPAAPEAIALITLRGIPLSVCPPFEGSISLDDILRAHADAALQWVRADGAIDRIPLLLGSIEVETVEVHSDAGSLEQGMSGGTVLVADQPAGLLFDVSDEGHTGRVARLDRIFERLTPHLASAVPTEVAHAPSGSLPYEIVRSTAAPVAPDNKASSLQGDGPGPWRVMAEGRQELVLKLEASFSGIVFDLTGVPDPPQTVEVLAGRTDHGPWQSLTVASLEPGDKLEQRRFSPVGLRFVLLRAYAPASRKTLAMARVSVLPK